MKTERANAGPEWRWSRGAPSPRQRVALIAIALVLGTLSTGLLLDAHVLAPRRTVREAVREAENRLRVERRLLARAEHIHARYRGIEAATTEQPEAVVTESGLLGRLVELAGPQVHVESIVPRRGGRSDVLEIALDCAGSLPALAGYLENLLQRTPGRISRLSLAADPAGNGRVVCRLSMEVSGLAP